MLKISSFDHGTDDLSTCWRHFRSFQVKPIWNFDRHPSFRLPYEAAPPALSENDVHYLSTNRYFGYRSWATRIPRATDNAHHICHCDTQHIATLSAACSVSCLVRKRQTEGMLKVLDLEGETQHFVAFTLILVVISIYYAMCMHREHYGFWEPCTNPFWFLPSE